MPSFKATFKAIGRELSKAPKSLKTTIKKVAAAVRRKNDDSSNGVADIESARFSAVGDDGDDSGCGRQGPSVPGSISPGVGSAAPPPRIASPTAPFNFNFGDSCVPQHRPQPYYSSWNDGACPSSSAVYSILPHVPSGRS
ncbi:hypothetical protein FRB98_005007, partial [Tulasnella sp. 332]